jgi:hypothetical protein
LIDFNSSFADSFQEGGVVRFVLIRVSNRKISDRSIKSVAASKITADYCGIC